MKDEVRMRNSNRPFYNLHFGPYILHSHSESAVCRRSTEGLCLTTCPPIRLTAAFILHPLSFPWTALPFAVARR